MLPASELTRLRYDMLYTMPDTCDVLALTRTADGYGGVNETWSVLYYSVSCRLDQKSGLEQTASDGVQWFSQDILSIPVTYTVTTAMRIGLGSVSYNILSANEGSGLAVTRLVLSRAGSYSKTGTSANMNFAIFTNSMYFPAVL